MQVGRLGVSVVVDPLGIPNGDYDLDAVVHYVGSKWSLFSGARLTIVPIGREHRYTEKLLVGVSTRLPSVLTDRVRIYSGLELAIHVQAQVRA